MSTDVLDKVKQLPVDKQKEVEDFVDYLLHKYVEVNSTEDIAENRRKNMGRLKGQIWMAEDFNATPEDFKDYI
jgi:hypothetical protein